MENLKIFISLISGGLAGAILNYLFNLRKERKQTIHYTIFKFMSALQIDSRDGNYKIVASQKGISSLNDNNDKLHSLVVIINNKGNRDYDKFEFGISGPNDINFVSAEKVNEEPLHDVEFLPENLSISSKVSTLRVSMSPFNRKDKYMLDIFFLCPRREVKQNEFIIDSKAPVVFRHEDMFWLATDAKNKWEVLWKQILKPLLPYLIAFTIFMIGFNYFARGVIQFLVKYDMIEINKKEDSNKIYDSSDDGIEE